MTSNPGRLTAIISVYTSSGDQHMNLGGRETCSSNHLLHI